MLRLKKKTFSFPFAFGGEKKMGKVNQVKSSFFQMQLLWKSFDMRKLRYGNYWKSLFFERSFKLHDFPLKISIVGHP